MFRSCKSKKEYNFWIITKYFNKKYQKCKKLNELLITIFMLLLLLLTCLIKNVFCCYTNITYYKTTYGYIYTQTIIPTPTVTCYTNIETYYSYPDSCDGSIRNQGYKCNTKENIKTIISCNTKTTEYFTNVFSSYPTIIPETYIYKLNCKNKTYSSLITII